MTLVFFIGFSKLNVYQVMQLFLVSTVVRALNHGVPTYLVYTLKP